MKKKKLKKLFGNYDSSHYVNREISWLEFNSRVLNEAIDERTPILERARFLSIYTSNLDEFVMKRVGGLRKQLLSNYAYESIDGKSPCQQLEMISSYIRSDQNKLAHAFRDLKSHLFKNDILLLKWQDLSEKERKKCNSYFLEKIYPILTPLSVDPGKPFPFISNLSYSLGLFIEHPVSMDKIFSRVKIPETCQSWLELNEKNEKTKRLVHTIDIIENNLSHLYHGVKITDIMHFKITRNADLEHDDEDAEDLMEQIEESINSRRLLEPIRIECLSCYRPKILKYLLNALDLDKDDLYIHEDFMDFHSLNTIADLNLSKLRYKNWYPQVLSWFQSDKNIFEMIKIKDRLVHHPYESFSKSVERFVAEAVEDPNVLSIKMTLYRTGENSSFISSLIQAAENGKQVVCLIELKARFDEKRNIYWANKLEQAGVHVVYGIVGLKTHSKITMIVRKEANGDLNRYCHIATGNYNSKTASLYTDVGLFTIDKKITNEIHEVFNYLTGTSLKVDYENLLISPINAKSRFIKMIQQQTKLAQQVKNLRIVAKMNSLEDVAISQALYEASRAGVKVDLIVRGFCCIKPQVKGLSENIRVISVIGRFLEHSRIFFFSDGDSSWSGKYFLGSADWMYRNMHKRVEVITPIFDKDIKEELQVILDTHLKDKRSSWEMLSSGRYEQLNEDKSLGSHQDLMTYTLNKVKDNEF